MRKSFVFESGFWNGVFLARILSIFRRHLPRFAVCTAALFLSLTATDGGSYQRPGVTQRVSIASDGTEGAGFFGFSSELPSLSPDGRYVVFDSIADNLVANDFNGNGYDVFVHDRVTGSTTQVSVSSQGQGGDNASFGARISGDGRYVVFESVAANLVPNDNNGGVRDIFLHDNVTGETMLVSKSIDNAGGNNDSYAAVISRDGRYIAFDSDASNLVPNDTNTSSDVFVYDRQTEALELVSVDSSGTQANAFSGYPSLSADGHYVTFNSRATNLPGNSLGLYQVYRRDRVTGETRLVSQPTDGSAANDSSFGGSISDDGKLVVFDSDASNMVPQDQNGVTDVFVRDIEAGTTKRISVDEAGVEGNGYSTFGRITRDGRMVAFQSDATNLVPEDTDGARDIFVHNLQSDATEMVSVASDGSLSVFPPSDDPFINQEVWHPAVSADGRFIAWDSTASNLVASDTNAASDVFVRDRGPGLGVGQLSVIPAAGQMDVSGWATFPAVVVSQASDPTNDGTGDAASLGGEITQVAVTFRPEQADLLFAFELASLPQLPTNGIPCTGITGCPPGVSGIAGTTYGFRFSSGSSNYEVRAFRSGLTAVPPAVPLFALYNCDSSCTEIARINGSIGSTGNEVLISLPLDTLNTGFAPALTNLSAYSALGDAATGPLSIFDQVNLPDGNVPVSSVSLGTAPLGTSESEVFFTTPANLTDGRFDNQLTLPAGYGVWARACLGSTCGPAVSWPLQLISVVSRKNHGSAGTFDVDLTNGNGLECRSGGANGDHTLVFTFSNPLNAISSVTATAATSSGTEPVTVLPSSGIGVDPHQYIVNLSGVPNASHLTVNLNGATDSLNSVGDVAARMDVLLGDVNASGNVDAADVGQVQRQNNKPLTSTPPANFRMDVNISGNIDAADVGQVQRQNSKHL